MVRETKDGTAMRAQPTQLNATVNRLAASAVLLLPPTVLHSSPLRFCLPCFILLHPVTLCERCNHRVIPLLVEVTRIEQYDMT